MLLVKFTKCYPASFMSHLDILRSILRACVRAGIKIRRSENAFNPHYKIYFTPPLPLTVESVAEYMCIDTDCDAEFFVEVFNKNAISGLKALNAVQMDTNPNVAGILTYSDFIVNVKANEEQKKILSDILKKEELYIEYEQKGKTVSKNVRDKIANIEVSDKIYLRLASGNDNLRVDRLLSGISGLELKFDGFDIMRTEQYTGSKDSLVPLYAIGESNEK